jgi:hypothetical protein
MIIAMLLAHLVGDYILQWDGLALWKSRAMKGVMVHSVIVILVTWLFSLPFDPSWWPGALYIGVTHALIDALQLRARLPVPPLLRFLLDQAAHFLVILTALTAGGYLQPTAVTSTFLRAFHDQRLLAFLLGYAFLTMPAWVLIKFVAYGLVKGCAPNFPEGANKYVGILERLLITTFVTLGQVALAPLIIIPRLIMEWPKVADSDSAPVYLAEFLGSMSLAVFIGLALNRL